MPYSRPTLTQLRDQVAQHLAAALPGSDPLLRYSNLAILGEVQAAIVYLLYGYIDWASRQATPFTADEEFLEAWAAFKAVSRLGASSATGTVTFTGTNGTAIPSGTPLVRADGWRYATTAPATISAGLATVAASADPGASGNAGSGSALTLYSAISGVNAAVSAATAFTGGADIETDDSLRSRMLLAFQSPAYGGAQVDYVRWAREVPGVTRSWCIPHGDGAGTVSVYFMLDVAQAAFGGFPQGTDGAATDESRASAAVGDQLTLANYLFSRQPVTALVRARAPAQNTVNFTITGLASASTAAKNAVIAAIKQVFLDQGSVGASGTTVLLSYVQAAVAAVPNTAGFLITSPAGNITSAAGALPVVGVVSFP